jgi:heptosyltransferase-3
MTAGAHIDLPERPRILVIVLRRLGDVLLSTPLIRALKSGIAGCSIDVVVFRGTEGMLQGNPDVDQVVVIPAHPTAAESAAIVGRLWSRYDLAISTQEGDRPTLFAWAAGRRRVGLVAHEGSGRWWKSWVLHHPVRSKPENHRVVELLRLVEAIGLGHHGELVCPAGSEIRAAIPAGRYAVLHAKPMFRIRQWTDVAWRALARSLADRGLAVVATGGPGAAEKAYLDRVWNTADPPVLRLDGQLGWPELVTLLRGAAVYVGPDTSISHLAAAAGTPTVAFYGPASPSRIGPWPIGGLEVPWAPAGTIQHRGNVWVVQHPLPCMPCNLLGCERHLESYSACLDELPVERVLAAVEMAIAVSIQ